MASHPPLPPVGSALAGALGAVFSNALVYPLDTVKTRLQALPPSATAPKSPQDVAVKPPRGLPQAIMRKLRKWEMLQMLIRILKTEGLAGAFKGFTANMLNTFSMQFAYFFFHTFLRTTTLRRLTKASPTLITPTLSTPTELFIGALAGAFAQIFTIPVAVIATRQQLHIPLSNPTSSKPTSTPTLFETASEIISESGYTGLWTGLKPGLVLTINPAITYGCFERLKAWRLARRGGVGKLDVWENFWLGVGSKTLATVVTYPYIFAKVRLQAKPSKTKHTARSNTGVSNSEPGNEEKETYAEIASHTPGSPSAVTATPESTTIHDLPLSQTTPSPEDRGAIALLRSVYRERGFLGWYQGLTAQIIKAVLCQGILFVSKDQFESYTWAILTLLTKFRARLQPILKQA